MDECVKTHRDDEVLVATINRPGACNAVNAAVATGLERALGDLDRDKSLRSAS